MVEVANPAEFSCMCHHGYEVGAPLRCAVPRCSVDVSVAMHAASAALVAGSTAAGSVLAAGARRLRFAAQGRWCESVRNICHFGCGEGGRCDHGFCHCEPGRWGVDCSRSRTYMAVPGDALPAVTK